MREDDVDGLLEEGEAEDVDLADVVRAALAAVVVRRPLVVAELVVRAVEDAGQAGQPQAADVDDARVAEVVDVVGHPPAVVELPEVVASLVVAANEDGQERRLLHARVVLVKARHVLVLVRAGHALQVSFVTEALCVCARKAGA